MTSAAEEGDWQKPNVVLIFMDDMTAWSLRSAQVHTPNLDRLRAEGTTFESAFNQGSLEPAVCTPARQMLMSGLTVFDASQHFLDSQRLGTTLTHAGYNTFFTGKWHNERAALEADYASVGPWAGGMLGSLNGEDDAYGRPKPDDEWDAADETRGGHWMTLGDGRVQHSSERWTDAAVNFLGDAPTDSPFFLHLAYHAPHDPRQAPQDFLNMYPQAEVLVPPNVMAQHPFDNGDLYIRDELLAPHPRTEAAVQLHRREYFAMITHADREIGRVLDAVDLLDAESDRRTIVVFSGDHGLALGEHGLFGKQNLYDHSTRVPLVFAGPGIAAGAQRTQPVYSGSIYATICELTRTDVPEPVQFSSLLPAIRDDQPITDEIFTAYGMAQRSIRCGGLKLIAYADSAHDQLFDIDEDPWELVNLAADSEYAGMLAELREQLARCQRELHDPAYVGAPLS
ncbi:sulfatase-like hydrolase/transferase (plasmid) [Coraliomargarita sp. W4R53]